MGFSCAVTSATRGGLQFGHSSPHRITFRAVHISIVYRFFGEDWPTISFASVADLHHFLDGRAGGRGNREREDQGKRPMVDPDPICEPVEETFEEEELAPIIMAQPTVHPRPVNVGEGSSGPKRKRKKGNKNFKSYQAAKARTENNHYIQHAWFKWFAENVEHKNTFRRYNTPGTNMGIRRFIKHLCELGRQTYVLRRQMIPTLPPWDKPLKTTLELWAQQVPSDFKEEYEKWINTQVFKDWSDGSYKQRKETHIAGRLATPEGKTSLLTKVEMWQR
ncbi:hypothetical protein R1sor_020175 [Riccia sorocarpa]|uniref:Uncharacterized protein n=1 Tax=Riccia sorocarpa TaxID=122646 RepID=A0ABD3IEP0_9MARC